ncbi:plasmid segregation protein ParM [Shewanella sp. 1_MG-2023]|uniref:plasmid segregation protein ParM domain-containing protein n=1 Tax=unclassified Shewanella TaxID=196818 RepID=UPI0026E478B9|nr:MULTISPECIES: plasmid segregation protein ParM domain-containing protein [unclassified Shewanella]MDO6609840.1 plasmid segregation protein ParM [Shewanella sp. 7_MG-2023]MDO6770018.1 plasmid segregation protein ParM [Shewanella sp. 2_MG-2023]MDO6793082.1 plasmid segregation protein ParM [Shewanella sp. 1_MG-2023]
MLNYQIRSTQYTFDATSDLTLSITHLAFQYDDLTLLSVHHALMQTSRFVSFARAREMN